MSGGCGQCPGTGFQKVGAYEVKLFWVQMNPFAPLSRSYCAVPRSPKGYSLGQWFYGSKAEKSTC